MWHICTCDGLLNPSYNFRKAFHTPEWETYRLTAGLNTLESRGDEKGGNRQEEDDIRRKTGKVEVKLCGATCGRERTVCKSTWKFNRKWRTPIRKSCYSWAAWACVPAEDCPLVFSIHGEPNGLLASTSSDGLCGDRLTGRRHSLAFFLVAVRTAGGRAVWRHQWSFPRHTHTPHTSCRQMEEEILSFKHWLYVCFKGKVKWSQS